MVLPSQNTEVLEAFPNSPHHTGVAYSSFLARIRPTFWETGTSFSGSDDPNHLLLLSTMSPSRFLWFLPPLPPSLSPASLWPVPRPASLIPVPVLLGPPSHDFPSHNAQKDLCKPEKAGWGEGRLEGTRDL